MKHLSQQMLAVEVRRPHLRSHRRRLQRALATPGISPERRRAIERDLNNLGKPKVYDPDDPPEPGALNGGPRPPVQIQLDSNSTRETLLSIPHTKLYLYALQHDFDVHPGDTKAKVVDTILRHLQGEQS